MKPPTLIVVVLLFALTGCGQSLEEQVRSDWDDHFPYNGIPAISSDIAEVNCVENPDLQVDGWCSIRIDDAVLSVDTVDIPFRDDELLWGEATTESS